MGFYFHPRASRRMARPPSTDDLPALCRVALIRTFFVCEMTHPRMRNAVLSPAGSVQVNSPCIVICSYGGTLFVSPTEICKLQHSWLNLPAKTTTPTPTPTTKTARCVRSGGSSSFPVPPPRPARVERQTRGDVRKAGKHAAGAGGPSARL